MVAFDLELDIVPELFIEVFMVVVAIIVDDISDIIADDISDIIADDITLSVITVSVIMVSGIVMVGAITSTGAGCDDDGRM